MADIYGDLNAGTRFQAGYNVALLALSANTRLRPSGPPKVLDTRSLVPHSGGRFSGWLLP